MSIFTEYVLNLTEDLTYEQIRNLHDNKQTQCETNRLLGCQDSVDKTLYPKVVTKSLCIRRLIGTMKLYKILKISSWLKKLFEYNCYTDPIFAKKILNLKQA